MPASGVLFSGNDIKTLKSNIDLNGNAKILSGSTDPTSVATSAPKGSIYLNTSTGFTYRKTDSGSSTNWLITGSVSSGDLSETSFSLSNNQSSAADVTGFLFSNASVRAFESLVSVYINATSSLYESFKLYGIQKGSSWEMSQSSVGDVSQVVFTITNAGQIQYTSANYSGFTSGTLKFRAITVSV